jgi:hypothetical protein
MDLLTWNLWNGLECPDEHLPVRVDEWTRRCRNCIRWKEIYPVILDD